MGLGIGITGRPGGSAPAIVVSVVRVDATHADWTFDQNVTRTGNVLEFIVDTNPSSATAQQGANVLRCTYPTDPAGTGWQIIDEPTNVTPAIAFPQAGSVA